MCLKNMFGLGGGGDQQSIALQLIQSQQAAAEAARARAEGAAAIASANGDTESSRAAQEAQLRKASLARGFGATLAGGAAGGSPAFKMLMGQ